MGRAVSYRSALCRFHLGDTLKIQILESIACAVNGGHGPGDIVDWKPEADAKSLIKQGIAKAVKGSKTKAETAAENKAVETATTE